MTRAIKSGDVKKFTMKGRQFELKKDTYPEITKEGVTIETESTQNGSTRVNKYTKVNASIKGLSLVVEPDEYNDLVKWKNDDEIIAVSMITRNDESIDSNMRLVGDALVFKVETNTVDIELESDKLQIVK